jgi:hypothetical protein
MPTDSAITLNSVAVNARAVGPGIGGILIATVGTGTCFLLDAASFVAVVTSLLMMDRSALRPTPPSGRPSGQVREGLRYAARTPTIAVPLADMGPVGLLAYEFSVLLPVLAEQSFHGGAEAYGFMTAAMGIGAVIGGLFTAARGRTGLRPMIFASVGFGVAILVCAFSPVLGLAYAALLFVGWASVSSIAIGNSTIQLSSELSMRGRVLALWQVAFQGTTPVGGPVIGWIIALTDPRIGLAVGGASCFAAAIAGAGLARRYRRTEALKAVQLESPASAGPLAARTPVGCGCTVRRYARAFRSHRFLRGCAPTESLRVSLRGGGSTRMAVRAMPSRIVRVSVSHSLTSETPASGCRFTRRWSPAA